MANERELEEIRSRLSIVELISAHTRLKKTGAKHKGLCPFHSEKSPSFTVDEERKLWHCFGCGEGGDMFSFVMKTENLGFGEAVEVLARRAGVELQPFSNASPDVRSQKERIIKLNKLASRYFSGILVNTKHGERFLKYLLDRGMPKEIIREYKLGAAPSGWSGLIDAVAKKSVTPEQLEEAGLAQRKENHFYDRFRERLIFPLTNVVGDIVGFAGRAMGDAQPKYLNSPQTALFDKGRILYNLDRARKCVEDGSIIITEGYFDVLSPVSVGIGNVVASMGTALTEHQCEMLRRYCSRVYLAYDADVAGEAASIRGIELLVERGLDIRVVRLPKGDDPDSLVRAGGAEAFRKQLAAAKDYFEYFLESGCARYDA